MQRIQEIVQHYSSWLTEIQVILNLQSFESAGRQILLPQATSCVHAEQSYLLAAAADSSCVYVEG